MKRLFLWLLLVAAFAGSCTQKTSEIRFIVASDMGRIGESEQKAIAELMGRFAQDNRIDFMAIAGDPIHHVGVIGVEDTVWNERIEDIYTAPSLHAIPWYVVLGNHEYQGCVQAIIDYSKVSERWNAPERYFTMTQRIGRKNNILFVFIDTTPLIEKYRQLDHEEHIYSDASEQSIERQINWLDSVLLGSNDRWKIVVGHHPVYAKTTKEAHERTDMQKRVGALFEKHGVDFYICGHIHNFQHIHRTGSKVHYVVNSSASQSRPVYEIDEVEGMIFGNPDPGFSVFTVLDNSVRFLFVNHTGETVYEHTVLRARDRQWLP
ncbi:MAG: metallophosphoesterase [Bacteroidales bacterium]|nr:metallophosphoesterase [Bacteroidales bacterium]MCL2737963.1 metallophosphoesterase [Bacteroidales bacterium]